MNQSKENKVFAIDENLKLNEIKELAKDYLNHDLKPSKYENEKLFSLPIDDFETLGINIKSLIAVCKESLYAESGGLNEQNIYATNHDIANVLQIAESLVPCVAFEFLSKITK